MFNWRQMFEKSNRTIIIKALLLFLCINAISLLGLFIYIPRAIFYYEYALVLIILIYFNKLKPAYVLFLFLLVLDYFDAFSGIYLFNAIDFYKNIHFLSLYKISFLQVVVSLMAIAWLFVIYIIIKKLKNSLQENKKVAIATIAVLYAIIFCIDFSNGSNFITDNKKAWKITDKNIASFLCHNYVYYLQQLNDPSSIRVDKYTEQSPVFAYFKNDTTHHQMVIIVESWGLINNPILRNNVREYVNEKISQSGFKSEWGTTNFSGSTTSAALKQFLNVKGDYRYFINHKSKASAYPSIFDIKQEQGYHTKGFHSYTGKMFARSDWWPNIGIQDVFFRENYLLEHTQEINSIQTDAPFPSIEDEHMFEYIFSKTDTSKTQPNPTQKEFTYFLTVNSHLPFRHKTQDISPTLSNPIHQLAISEEAKNQLMLIHEQLGYFIERLAKSKYQSIIIMGDHIPPFINLQDRLFYHPTMVPYLYLRKD